MSFFLNVNKPKEYPPYLSTSPSPTGVKAFYTYLESELPSVDRVKQSPKVWNNSDNQLLIMVEPMLISKQEQMNDYLEFVRAGNTLLILKRNLDGMFGIKTDYGDMNEEIVTIENKEGTEFEATSHSQMRIIANDEDDVLMEDSQGVIALKREAGKGQIIAVNSPDWLTNEYILEEDNLELILGLIEEASFDTVLFDEFAHQSSQVQSLTNLYPMWLLVAGLQLILLTLLWLLYKGKRFGPIIMPREDYVRFSDERITALAAWYQKAKAYEYSLSNQAEYLRLLLWEKWGISSQKEWKDIKELISSKVKDVDEDEISTFVNGIESVLENKNVTKQEYILWSKRIDRLRKEVEEG